MKCKMAHYSSFVPVVIRILKSDIGAYVFAFVVVISCILFLFFDIFF